MRRLVAIALASIGLGVASPAIGAALVSLDQLSLVRTVELGFIPTEVLFRPGSHQAVLIGTQRDGSQVLTLDRETFVQKHLDELPFLAEAAAFHPNGDILFVVGRGGGGSQAAAINLDATGGARVSIVSLGGLVSLPSVAVDATGRLYVGDATSPTILTIPSYVFDLRHLDQIDAAEFGAVLNHPYGGVRGLVVSDYLSLVFVAANDFPQVSAIELGRNNRVSDEYTAEVSKDGATALPLGLAGPFQFEVSETVKSSSLLVANHFDDSLAVLDVDPLFRTLDVVATITVGHDLEPGAAIRFIGETRLVPQPTLLAADENQTVIVSGNIYSRQLVQFARSEYGLERVAEIKLTALPTDIVLDEQGATALVTLAGRRELVVLETGAEAGAIENESREKVRQLQRLLSELGLPVGAVDGVQGPATDRALQRLQKDAGVSFELDDLDRALEVVTQIKDSCGTSGLRCLVTTQGVK